MHFGGKAEKFVVDVLIQSKTNYRQEGCSRSGVPDREFIPPPPFISSFQQKRSLQIMSLFNDHGVHFRVTMFA